MREIFEKYRLPKAYIDFLHKNKNGISQALFNAQDCKNYDGGAFYDLWNEDMLLEETFSDGPNYQIPLNIIDEIVIDFHEPSFFDEQMVKNMFAIGLSDSGFLCFNPHDNSLCVLHSDGFLMTIAPSFEFFINNDSLEIPILVKIALLHYQFETIHPFLDGNGRIGRLIIPLLLLENNILTKPCFYISNYLEKNRTRYYDALNRVRTENDLIGWIVFFLEAVIETSENAKNKFNKVVKLVDEYREYQFKLKGKPENIAKIFNALYNDPVLSISDMIQITGLSRSTVSSIVREMEKKQIIYELTNYSRNKLYLLREYFIIFAE